MLIHNLSEHGLERLFDLDALSIAAVSQQVDNGYLVSTYRIFPKTVQHYVQ